MITGTLSKAAMRNDNERGGVKRRPVLIKRGVGEAVCSGSLQKRRVEDGTADRSKVIPEKRPKDSDQTVEEVPTNTFSVTTSKLVVPTLVPSSQGPDSSSCKQTSQVVFTQANLAPRISFGSTPTIFSSISSASISAEMLIREKINDLEKAQSSQRPKSHPPSPVYVADRASTLSRWSSLNSIPTGVQATPEKSKFSKVWKTVENDARSTSSTDTAESVIGDENEWDQFQYIYLLREESTNPRDIKEDHEEDMDELIFLTKPLISNRDDRYLNNSP
ncbi:hypothetical protein GWI33_020026 [Rhynchophorus ferrugineus]|uniref:Uncharacterized protein n=1 Tax=Rhynchophorus ferrugineus TaxID=354439 RepID=A0A834HRJ1_RHYFE|nr:hypothetical protein GWI33_020026 [Rhynchophorus ferrugineus]